MIRRKESYELSDHLENVRVVIADKKEYDVNGTHYSEFTAMTYSYTDYYPYGAVMPGRSGNSDVYRYGFNGTEKDDEAKGLGNQYDLGLRTYDPRLGRMFSRDPRAPEYPWQSPYVYHRNSPISIIDYLGGGDNGKKTTVKKGEGLSQVAKRTGVSVDNIIKFNPDIFGENGEKYNDGTWVWHPEQVINLPSISSQSIDENEEQKALASFLPPYFSPSINDVVYESDLIPLPNPFQPYLRPTNKQDYIYKWNF